MTSTLERTDTGEIAVIRPIDPDPPVSAPYSRACGLLDKWAKAERHAVDEFAAWIEGQAAQAHAEMRLLCDELGLPVAWAEFRPVSVNRAELPPDPAAELSPEQLDREYALGNMVTLARRGWTPERPLPDREAEGAALRRSTNVAAALSVAPRSRAQRRSWSAEWAAFRDDVKDMARDLRWWKTEED
jgi:hypothetical protein